jgi:carboxylesterase type B
MTRDLKRSNRRGAFHKQISLAAFAREAQLLERTDEGDAMERVNAMIFDNQCRVENDPQGAERRAWGDQ